MALSKKSHSYWSPGSGEVLRNIWGRTLVGNNFGDGILHFWDLYLQIIPNSPTPPFIVGKMCYCKFLSLYHCITITLYHCQLCILLRSALLESSNFKTAGTAVDKGTIIGNSSPSNKIAVQTKLKRLQGHPPKVCEIQPVKSRSRTRWMYTRRTR